MFEKGELPLQDIGMLQFAEVKPAYDVTINAITAPGYVLKFDPAAKFSAQPLMRYICRTLELSEEDAFEEYMTFIQAIKSKLQKDGAYSWKGIGEFNQGDKIGFIPEETDYLAPEPVVAQRLMSHQRTVSEMAADQEPETTFVANDDGAAVVYDDPFASTRQKERWWIGVVILFVIGSLLIAMREMGVW